MKRNFWLILIPVLVTGLCGLLSFLAGHYVPWTPLGTPPEPAVAILRTTVGSVTVEANSGKVYRCAYDSRSTSSLDTACEWQEINLADFGPGAPEKDDLCSYLLPPGQVVDSFYVCSGPHWRYVVLADGSVWTFYSDGDVTFSPYMFTEALWPTCGPGIGLLLGIVTFGLLRWRSRHTT